MVTIQNENGKSESIHEVHKIIRVGFGLGFCIEYFHFILSFSFNTFETFVKKAKKAKRPKTHKDNKNKSMPMKLCVCK